MFLCLLTAKLPSDETFFIYFMTENYEEPILVCAETWEIHLWIMQKIVGVKQIQCVLTLLISKEEI